MCSRVCMHHYTSGAWRNTRNRHIPRHNLSTHTHTHTHKQGRRHATRQTNRTVGMGTANTAGLGPWPCRSHMLSVALNCCANMSLPGYKMPVPIPAEAVQTHSQPLHRG
jgi:hypothetical protein